MVWVHRCASNPGPPIWQINTARHNSVADFTYGETPAGWSTYRTAESLTPGCYYIHAQGAGIMGSRFFDVDSMGRVVLKNMNASRPARDTGMPITPR